MPANMSEERRACMAAYGAELITVPAGNMELARDLAQQMQVLSIHHSTLHASMQLGSTRVQGVQSP